MSGPSLLQKPRVSPATISRPTTPALTVRNTQPTLPISPGRSSISDASSTTSSEPPTPSVELTEDDVGIVNVGGSAFSRSETASNDGLAASSITVSPTKDSRVLLREQLLKSASYSRPRSDRDMERGVNIEKIELDNGGLSKSVFSAFTRRKYYVLSSSGKLVWTSEQDEEEATGHVGVMQAIVSLFEEEGDMIRYVKADHGFRIGFMRKLPLYLVATSDWGEPESVLRSQMELIYSQIVSIVSASQLSRLFSKQPNYDLRRLLSGTESFFTSLIDNIQTGEVCFTSLMASLRVFRISDKIRSEVGKALVPETKMKDLLYLLIIANGKILTLVRPRKHSVHPTDLFILLNTILSSPALTSTESWLPICLPKFNDQGFLHAFVSFSDQSHKENGQLNLGLIFISADREAFIELQDLKEKVMGKLENVIPKIDEALGKQAIGVVELGIPGLRHFIFKSRVYVQVVIPEWEGTYEDLDNRRRLIVLYQKAHDAIKGRMDPSTTSSKSVRKTAAKLVYLRTEWEIVVGAISPEREVYMALSAILPKSAVVSALAALDEWIKRETDNVFLINAASF